ncbi:2-dehydro-3-deoxyphosphogluconate aldolase, partial [Streptococcus agalactiae]|nr:2-dehydro-3-deoxyphosphogluconate aldolase [Streptococcus agalactiae]MCC9985027.1 2-dehydro-3-deoxyphosphogluconate aldolase [Streptococcus agalactiae]
MLNQLKNNYFFAVIRGKSSEDALEIAKHAILGGIRNIEVTFSTPEASKVIKQLSD